MLVQRICRSKDILVQRIYLMKGISEYLISYFQNREAKYLTYQIAFYLICIGFLIPSKNPKLKFL